MTTATGDQLDAAASTVEPSPANLRHKKRDALDQLDGSAASSRARASTVRPDTYCQYCGRRMSPGRHGRRRYCSNACRTGAYKKRQRSALRIEQ